MKSIFAVLFIFSLTSGVPIYGHGAVNLCANIFSGPTKRDTVILGLRKVKLSALANDRITAFVEDFMSAFPEPIQAQLRTVVVRIKISDAAIDVANPLSNEVVVTLPRKLQSETDASTFSKELNDSLLALGHELGHLAFGKRLFQAFPDLYPLAVLGLAKHLHQPKGRFESEPLRQWRTLTDKLKADEVKFSSLSDEALQKLNENSQTLRSLMGAFHEFIADAAIGIHIGDLNALPRAIARRDPSPNSKRRRFDIKINNNIEWLYEIFLDALGNRTTLDYFILQPAKFELYTLLPELHTMNREKRKAVIAAVLEAAIAAMSRIHSHPNASGAQSESDVFLEELRSRKSEFR